MSTALQDHAMPLDDLLLKAYIAFHHQIYPQSTPAQSTDFFTQRPEAKQAWFAAFKQRFGAVTTGSQINSTATPVLGALTSAEQTLFNQYLDLLARTVRTNIDQVQREKLDYVALKFDSSHFADQGEKPHCEVFVYGPTLEGVHLRADLVARGGIRWSSRLDFRTEALQLMQAQQVKNCLIVPAGAKGAFLVKTAGQPATPAQVEAAYQLFIHGLLDVTDNIQHNQIVPAPGRRYDGNDPYLVVAADKGTATFSDLGNQISQNRGFWLDDAFASGGSTGYDHKRLGITAKGVWISVEHHLSKLNQTVQSPLSVLAIGDMAGDVCGNGLVARQDLKVVAAFNHQHIFIDPNPDVTTSFHERLRLFESRLGWDAYQTDVLSQGGGVWSRQEKFMALSREAQALLGLSQESISPEQCIQALLCLPVDIIWNGGIGTFIKASHQSHSDAADSQNDAIRINANQLRARIIAEGGNLGCTQAARIEYARKGGQCFADFIDNSAGVHCSDREVNLKIWYQTYAALLSISREQRNQQLQAMTAQVCQQVLEGNQKQVRTIEWACFQAQKDTVLSTMLAFLERYGHTPQAQSRAAVTAVELQQVQCTLPEMSFIVAQTKNILKKKFAAQHFEAEAFLPLFAAAFPSTLPPTEPALHPLYQAIVGTQLANALVDELGPQHAELVLDSSGNVVFSKIERYLLLRKVFHLQEWYAWLTAKHLPFEDWRQIGCQMWEFLGAQLQSDKPLLLSSSALEVPDDASTGQRLEQTQKFLKLGLPQLWSERLALWWQAAG